MANDPLARLRARYRIFWLGCVAMAAVDGVAGAVLARSSAGWDIKALTIAAGLLAGFAMIELLRLATALRREIALLTTVTTQKVHGADPSPHIKNPGHPGSLWS